MSYIHYTLYSKICCLSPHRFVCKLEMYSINTGVLLLTFYSENFPLKHYYLLHLLITRVHTVFIFSPPYANSCMHLLLSTIPKSHLLCPGCQPGLHPEVFVEIPNSLSQASDKHPSHNSLQLQP